MGKPPGMNANEQIRDIEQQIERILQDYALGVSQKLDKVAVIRLSGQIADMLTEDKNRMNLQHILLYHINEHQPKR